MEEKVYTYQEFIASIGNADGIGFHGFLRDLSQHLKDKSRQKYQEWKDSGFQTVDDGNGWYADAVRLYAMTESRRKPVKVYRYLAELLDWKTRNAEMAQLAIDKLMETAPSGSGIDNGTKLRVDSTSEKIKFHVDFHHMDNGGYYDGWTEHIVTVSPSLHYGAKLTISGKNRNEIKDYLHEVFETWLNSDYEKESGKLL
ncbi:MAG TPA: hypothetical protein PLP33_24725 [Leptospiraceae bacterium]|nr:hypothetical protein [Leptospiraceae bacterium]